MYLAPNRRALRWRTVLLETVEPVAGLLPAVKAAHPDRLRAFGMSGVGLLGLPGRKVPLGQSGRPEGLPYLGVL
jgi:hypothetical protein